MERGTERERTAVRERWTAMERRRARASRLLAGLVLLGTGVILVLLAVARETCFTTARGGIVDCTPLAGPPFGLGLLLLGVVALGFGLAKCRAVFRDGH
ncbi:hypothetical protein [Halorussus sp. AFM4]|uniref:hypothetical protein n=1 Tax=Halorussus sp. AFM4 TaxID=3421651 RepID=UPI003EBB11CA